MARGIFFSNCVKGEASPILLRPYLFNLMLLGQEHLTGKSISRTRSVGRFENDNNSHVTGSYRSKMTQKCVTLYDLRFYTSLFL